VEVLVQVLKLLQVLGLHAHPRSQQPAGAHCRAGRQAGRQAGGEIVHALCEFGCVWVRDTLEQSKEVESTVMTDMCAPTSTDQQPAPAPSSAHPATHLPPER
jgi:hypothetical protein